MAISSDTAARLGQLRHRVTIWERTLPPAEVDGEAGTWEVFSYQFARLRPISGQESTTGDQVVATLRYEIAMHLVDGIDPTMRITMGSRVFEIDHVYNVEERNRWTVAMCTERHDLEVPGPPEPDPGRYGEAYGAAYG